MSFFESLFDHSPDGIIIARRSGAFLRVNDAACAMLGYSREELLRLTRPDILADPTAVMPAVTSPLRAPVVKLEMDMRRADGSALPVELTSVLIDGEGDGDPLTFAIFRDIGQRRSIEAAREAEIGRFRQFFDSLHEGVAFLEAVRDSQGRISSFFRADANETFDRLTGNTIGEPRSLHDVQGHDIEERLRIFSAVLETGEPIEYERELFGRQLNVRIARQSPDLLGVTVTDLTAERTATAAQRTSAAAAAASAEELQAVLDAVPAAVWIARDARADTITGNRFGSELVRARRNANLSLSAPDGERPEGFAAMIGDRVIADDELPLQRSARRGEVLRDFEFDLVLSDGERRHLLGNSAPMRDASGAVTGAVGAFIDITERKESELQLAVAVARFDAMMSASPAAVWIKDSEGRLIYLNLAAERLFGLLDGAWRGRSIDDVFTPELVTRLRATDARIRRSGEPEFSTDDFSAMRGEPHWRQTVRFRFGAPSRGYYIGAMSYDITAQRIAEEALRASESEARRAQLELQVALEENRKTEEKFRQAQKMEAIGRLAGGIAHDFNNLLTIILGNCELLALELRNEPFAEDVAEIRRAGERAAELTRQLLAFSRKQVLEPRLLNLNDAVSGMQRMIARTLGEDVELKLLLARDLQQCLVDPGQMEQVLLNLVINARDAMPTGGQLTIETSNVYLDEEYADAHPDARIGPHVLLSVSDSGEGMTAEVKSRLFEPFFTTKGVGKGTGLGLSTVYGIVQQSGGTIWVYSELGQGTTMKVYLPVATTGTPAEARSAIDPRALTGTETILLVEDDDQVRATIARMLRMNGYHVIQASNGGEAFLICEQHGGTIDLLLTDIVMPRMNGRQLAERLLTIRPSLEVIYMSGYTENVVVHHGVVDSGVNFVAKPLTSDKLLPKLREVLDARR